MLRRDKTDELYSLAIKRYQKENPDYELTNQDMEGIWYSIYGIMCREGEEAAREYVESAKLNTVTKEVRGYC